MAAIATRLPVLVRLEQRAGSKGPGARLREFGGLCLAADVRADGKLFPEGA